MNDEKFNYQILEEKINKLTLQNTLIISELDLIKKALINNYNYKENKNFCPICGEFSVFEDYGEITRKNVRCPNCGSVERHRMLYLLFQQRYMDILTNKNIKLLHFAPEKMFYEFFIKNENIDYYPVDIDPTLFEPRIHIRKKVNMENIPYPDNYFDFIYNSHVLEHVPNDIKGMNELYRVLKDDGICITLVPYYNYLEETLEKEEYNTPELRSKYYGQYDHMRKYGSDFKDRLESVGFNVELVTLSDISSSKTDTELFKLGSDTFFICTK